MGMPTEYVCPCCDHEKCKPPVPCIPGAYQFTQCCSNKLPDRIFLCIKAQMLRTIPGYGNPTMTFGVACYESPESYIQISTPDGLCKKTLCPTPSPTLSQNSFDYQGSGTISLCEGAKPYAFTLTLESVGQIYWPDNPRVNMDQGCNPGFGDFWLPEAYQITISSNIPVAGGGTLNASWLVTGACPPNNITDCWGCKNGMYDNDLAVWVNRDYGVTCVLTANDAAFVSPSLLPVSNWTPL